MTPAQAKQTRAIPRRRGGRQGRRPASTSALQSIAVVIGLIVSLWINFHWYWPNFNLAPGDRGDTRLVIFILEHWLRVLQGLEPFFRLQMFYPDPNALAYADGLFLFGLPYAGFRLLGLDYFSSYQWLLALLVMIGYAAWFAVLRRALRQQTGIAVLGAILLTCMNSLQFLAANGQLRGMMLYPLLIWLLWGFVGSQKKTNWKATLSLAGFAAGLGLLFFTSYYPAWFFLFTLVLFGLIALIAGILSDSRAAMTVVRGFIVHHKWQLLAAVAAFGISLAPFLVTYAPLIRANSSRTFNLVLDFAPSLRDVVNVSSYNYVWARLLQSLGFDFGNSETQTGSPILILILFGIFLLRLIIRLRHAGWRQAYRKERMLALLSFTAIVLIAISIRVDGFSLWAVVYDAVPGASALRAIGRILILVDMIVIIAVTCGMDEILHSDRARTGQQGMRSAAAAALLGAALIAEQVNAMPFRLNKAQELASMRSWQSPQVPCRAFFMSDAPPDDAPYGSLHMDAVMISMQLGIPTVNGYSGIEPHKAFGLAPRGIEYRYRVLDWLRVQGATEGICELDLADRTFRPVDVEREYALAQQGFRMELLDDYSALYAAITRFLRDGNSMANLYPQRLEEGGYLDAGFGYQTGTRYRWLGDRFWIGEKDCGNQKCFGIAVVGTFSEVKAILEQFGSQARRSLFPSPQTLEADSVPPDDAEGELLLIFPALDAQD